MRKHGFSDKKFFQKFHSPEKFTPVVIIGIDASRAFLKNRTGIEEYSYQVIKHLAKVLGEDQACSPKRRVVLYLRKNQQVDFELPQNWEAKVINWPRLWTQMGLSLEMLINKVDKLFVPAHTVPLIHPQKSIVVIHGLEYEFVKNAYSFLDRMYMRFCIKNSCRWANEIISVSENTKKDLIYLYKVSGEKIKVIYEGYESDFELISNLKSQISNPYLLFIGRIEERKNISNIIKAFEILKEKYQIPHKLVLAGRPGYGYDKIKSQISNLKSQIKQDIVELGYVSEEEKWQLLQKAGVFVFPTLYEGFGIPVLEAQSVCCPVVAANNSSIPEVIAQSALLVEEKDPKAIAENVQKLLSDQSLKNAIIAKGLENVKRFSWDKCANEIAQELLK